MKTCLSYTAAPCLTAAVLLLAPGPAGAQPRVPTHVACIGDSITQGVGASPGKSWPSDLQAMLGAGVQVKNFGLSGRTMLTTGDVPYEKEQAYQDAQAFVKGAGPGAVVDIIIMLGTNDSKPFNWTPAGKPKQDTQYATDYGAMVDTFTAIDKKAVVYLAFPPWAADAGKACCSISGQVILNEEIPLIKQVAALKGMPTIDVNTPLSAHQGEFPDGVHPNDTGAALIAQTMHDGLLRVPTVTLTSPAPGAALPASTLTLTADASGGTVPLVGVEFFEDTTSLGTATQSPFSASWAGPAPGLHVLTAKVTDRTTASATSAPVNITIGAAAGSGGQASGGQGGAGGAAGASPAGAGGSGIAGTGGSGIAGKGGSGNGGAAGSGNGGAGHAGMSAAGHGGMSAAGHAGTGGAAHAGGSGQAGAGGAGQAGLGGHAGGAPAGDSAAPSDSSSSGGCALGKRRGSSQALLPLAALAAALRWRRARQGRPSRRSNAGPEV